jgi:HEAT repeat protein
VAIRSSSAKEIDSLIADLASERAVVRETALARLTVIGSRAVVHLVALVENGSTASSTRLAALRALDAIDDVRAIDVAKAALGDADRAVAVAAAGLLQRFLTGSRGVEATDVLTAKALERSAPDAVRLAALVALEELGRAPLEPLWNALAEDASRSVRAHVAQARRGAHAEIGVTDVIAVDDPEKLRRELSLRRVTPTLPELQAVIDRIRVREESETGAQRDAWRRARGAAHVALARRGSRLALYDLRESLERTKTPLPVEFMAALSLAGDATCLESIAAAHAHATGADNEWWRDHLADAFHAIVQREKLTGRHAVMKKIRKRWPAILSTTSRT